MGIESLLEKRWTVVLLGALIILFPAVLNGQPFVFPDSEIYYLLGRGMVEAVFGVSDPVQAVVNAPSSAPSTPLSEAEPDGGLLIAAGGRSPLYSLGLYGTAQISVWLTVFGQALIVSWFIVRLIEWLRPEASPEFFLGLIAGLTVFTPLAFHTAMLMPDIFAAVLVMAVGFLLFRKDLGIWETGFLVLTVLVCAIMHTTILMLGGFILLAALIVRVFGISSQIASLPKQGLIAIALLGAITVNTVYETVVERMTETPLMSPPFLMARTIADGPGLLYMQKKCAETELETPAYCVFDGTEFWNHNDFLWGAYGASPNYISLARDDMKQVKAEEAGFVIGVLTNYPVYQASISIRNALEQLFGVAIGERTDGMRGMLRNAEYQSAEILSVLPQAEACRADRENCQKVPFAFNAWHFIILYSSWISLIAFFYVMGMWTWRRSQNPKSVYQDEETYYRLGLMLLFVTLINAGICGAASGAHDRYQARLFWLVPLFLTLALPLLKLRFAKMGFAKVLGSAG